MVIPQALLTGKIGKVYIQSSWDIGIASYLYPKGNVFSVEAPHDLVGAEYTSGFFCVAEGSRHQNAVFNKDEDHWVLVDEDKTFRT